MGGLLGRSKDQNKKPVLGFSLCPGRSKKQHSIKQNPSSKSTSKDSEWTDVHLQVPEFISDLNSQIIEEPPVPPPRKQKIKTLERKVVKKVENLQQNASNWTSENRIPIEEPIIIPKKEPIHICDGTHHHCTNIVNGNIIHNHEHIAPKRLKRDSKSPVRPKNTSTVSLPNADELKHKPKEKNADCKSEKNISTTSLHTDRDITISPTTTARLENYISKCKSFNELSPSEMLDKIQDLEPKSDSEESWNENNEWGMEMIEDRTKPGKAPVEPKYRLESPYLVKEAESPAVSESKNISERRESIDDFFDARAASPYAKTVIEEIKNETTLGRRGSDGFFPELKMPELSPFQSDIYHTNAFLQNESYTYEVPRNMKKIATDDEKDLLNTMKEYLNSDASRSSEAEEVDIGSTPVRKSGNVQHSNLLKIIQENSIVLDKNEDDSKYTIPEITHTSLSDDDKRKSDIDSKKP